MTARPGKNVKGRIGIARRVVQIAVLALFCAPVIVSGTGLFGLVSGKEELSVVPSDLPFFGSLISSSVVGVNVLDPYALLEVLAASASITAGAALAAVPPLLVYGLVRGRAFCGWVCPVNLVLEGVDWVRRKLGLSAAVHALPRRTKMIVSIVVLVICAATGMLVFEMFSPIAFLNRGMLFGSLAGGFTMAAIVVAELFWAERVWCRALCPLGGFYEAIGTFGLVSVKMDAERCVHCDACRAVCLCDPEILDSVLDEGADHVSAGDCMLCGRCVDVCPTDALSIGPAVPFPKPQAAEGASLSRPGRSRE